MKKEKLGQLGKALIVYLGSAWVLLEALSFLMEKYDLSEGYQDLLILILIFGLPVTLIFNGFGSLRHPAAIILLVINSGIAIWMISSEIRTFNDVPLSVRTNLGDYQTVLVVPFTSVNGADSLDYLLKGMQESLSNKLGELQLFTVMDPGAYREPSNISAGLYSITSNLEIDALVGGTVFLINDTIQMQVKITNAETELVLWTKSYTKPVRQVLRLFEEISREIAVQLTDLEDPGSTALSEREVDPQAYLLYEKGRFAMENLSERGLNTALAYYEKAIALDPSFAPPYAGVAWVWGGKFQMGYIDYETMRTNGEPALAKAVQLDSMHAHVQHVKGTYGVWWKWEFENARKGFEKAIEINPSYAAAYSGYSHYLIVMRKFEEAKKAALRAVELDPLNDRHKLFYVMVLNFSREYDKIEEVMTDSTGMLIEHALTYSTLRTTYHLTGETDKALEMWKRHLELRRDTTAIQIMQKGRDKDGYRGALRAMAELLIQRKEGAGSKYIPAWQIFTLYVRAGENGHALEWMKKAFEEHDPNMPYINVDPIFDPLRGDIRFMEIKDAVGI